MEMRKAIIAQADGSGIVITDVHVTPDQKMVAIKARSESLDRLATGGG